MAGELLASRDSNPGDSRAAFQTADTPLDELISA